MTATVKSITDGIVKVVLREGEDGIAAGQACVLYADGSAEARVLGGGWIERTLEGVQCMDAQAGGPQLGTKSVHAAPFGGIGTGEERSEYRT